MMGSSLGIFLKTLRTAVAQSVSHANDKLQKNFARSCRETSTATVNDAGIPARCEGFSESAQVAIRLGGVLLTRCFAPLRVIACDAVVATVFSNLPVTLRLANCSTPTVPSTPLVTLWSSV